MKKLIHNLIFGKDIVSGLIALAIIASIALGCNCGKDLANAGDGDPNATSANDAPVEDADSDMPDDRLLKALVKATTAEFANAISTEDFTKLHQNASTDFQQTYTVEQAKEIFADAIKNKRALLPVLAKLVSMDPEFSPAPYIRREQNTPILVVKGEYATKPKALGFEYEYVKRGGRFKLLKLILK